MYRYFQIWFINILCVCIFNNVYASSVEGVTRNVLLINSYHQGLAWTDSLTSGIVTEIKKHPGCNLYIEYLNSKQFGKSKFSIETEYLKAKYSEIKIDGILVTDNDALDFVIQYENDLFSNLPVVFVGISNPEDYSFEGSRYYGIKESGSNDNVIGFVRNLLPTSTRLLIITDRSTTGLIYRKEFLKQAQNYSDFTVLFPNVMDLDSIYHLVQTPNDFDAIYYVSISHDKNGRLVDQIALTKKICSLARVPVFSNDPIYNGIGIVGGIFQSGKNHGIKSVELLLNLIDGKLIDLNTHVYSEKMGTFFDHFMVEKYKISISRLPANSLIINEKSFFDRENFVGLLIVLAVMGFLVVVLSVVIRRRKIMLKKSDSQLKKIELQKSELEIAKDQLSKVIIELENANARLNDINISLSEAKKKAEESDNLKSAFLANVSHEIRTPLNSIVGFSSLLIEPDLSEETKKMYIDMIESNTESLLVLVDEIIDLSKIEAQQLTLKIQEFCIDDLVNELFQTFNHSHKKENVDLRISRISADQELFAFSDRVRVKQIFVNLLTNAFKFTESGFIETGYKLDENDKFVFYVQDSGIGISKEFHKEIFHRFRKLNENSGKIFRGTGLGLAITQKLVELLGGKIWLESTLGEGSTFYFTLDGLVLKNKLE